MVGANQETTVAECTRRYKAAEYFALAILFKSSGQEADYSPSAIEQRSAYLRLRGQLVDQRFDGFISTAIAQRELAAELLQNEKQRNSIEGSKSDKGHLRYLSALKRARSDIRSILTVNTLGQQAGISREQAELFRKQHVDQVHQQDRVLDETRALTIPLQPAPLSAPLPSMSDVQPHRSIESAVEVSNCTPPVVQPQSATDANAIVGNAQPVLAHSAGPFDGSLDQERLEFVSIDTYRIVVRNTKNQKQHTIYVVSLKANNPLLRYSTTTATDDLLGLLNWQFCGRAFERLVLFWTDRHILGKESRIDASSWEVSSYQAFFVEAAKFQDFDALSKIVPPLEACVTVHLGLQSLERRLSGSRSSLLQEWEVDGLGRFATQVTEGLVRSTSSGSSEAFRAAQVLSSLFMWAQHQQHQHPQICLAIMSRLAGHHVKHLLATKGGCWTDPAIYWKQT